MNSKVIGGIFLIAGTTIGAGMLGLPIVTGFAGFYPTLLFLLFFWAYMTYTAFLILEVNLWTGAETNLITMAHATLGKWAELLSWVIYLLLLYLLTSAYMAGSAPAVQFLLKSLMGWDIPVWAGAIPLIVIVGLFVFEGTKYVDYLNRILMTALILGFVGIFVFVAPHIDHALLSHSHVPSLLLAISLIATSFGFHIIIPTLVTYLDRDVENLRKVIFIGSLLPLAVYVIWEMITLGTIPLNGEYSLSEGYKEDVNSSLLLSLNIGNSLISLLAQFFAFFAVITSFLGVSKSLMDFLSDGLHIPETLWGSAKLIFLTLIPPFLFIFFHPRAFIVALQFAGAFGVVILLGLLPAMMAWGGRYKKGFKGPFRAWGGKPALIIVMVISVLVILIEIGDKVGAY
ncbi:MAG: aromatic amino acid transport family protein [Waddliaceae bacterium]